MAAGLILVDAGNSRIKWGRAEAGLIRAAPPFPSGSAELAGHLDSRWGSLEPPRAVYVSNVAGPELAEGLAAWVASHWGIEIRFAVARKAACGVTNGYERPETLGVDRWVGLIGLRRHYGVPACLADCGTATTFDVLDAEGRHLGGLIAPGLASMKRALLRETHGVATFESDDNPGFLGRSTAAAVRNGVLHASAGLLEKCLAEAAGLLGRRPVLVLSGGDGAAIGRCLGIPYRFDADLVLRGLLTLAETES